MERSALVVEDNPEVSRLLVEALEADDFLVTAARDCAEFYHAVEHRTHALLVLDIGLPDGDGFTLARQVRQKSDVGILILTGRADEVDAVFGLEIGADDYLAKPVRLREFRSRVKAVLRRSSGAELTPQTWLWGRGDAGARDFGAWKIDTAARLVTGSAGNAVDLTTSEFEVLSCLVQAAPQVVTRDSVTRKLRGSNWAANDRLVDGIVSRLRKKLVSGLGHDPVRTVRKVGYALNVNG